MHEVKTTLALFYLTNQFDAAICMIDGILPSEDVLQEETSKKVIEELFKRITGIVKWPSIRLDLASVEEGDNLINMVYFTVLPDKQKLKEEYNWVKISEFKNYDISREDMNTIKNIFIKRTCLNV